MIKDIIMEKVSNKVCITLDLKGICLLGLVIVIMHWLYSSPSTTIINNYGGNTYNTYNVSYASPAQGLPSFNEAAKVERKTTKNTDDNEAGLCYGADCSTEEDDNTGTETQEPTSQENSSQDEVQDEVGTPSHSNTSDSTIVATGEDSVIDEAEDKMPVVTTPDNNTNVSEDDLIPEVIDPNDGKQRAKVIVNLNIKQ